MQTIEEISTHTLLEWIEQDKDFRLIDVRSEAECARGLIPRGEALPLHLLPLRLQELDNNKPLVFYCRTGARSAQACMYLAQRGFDRVINLRGGIVDWANRGLPLQAAVA